MARAAWTASRVPELPGLELLNEIGRGAHTVVYKARKDGRHYAVKVPLDVDSDAESSFQREAVTLARLDHPGLPRVVDVGVAGAVPYLTMEFVDGRTLAWLIGRGALPEYRVLTIARDLAAALAAVHRLGLVHRDVKPRNILLDRNDHARLIDFGLAVKGDRHGGDVAGTFLYAAPEQTGMLSRPVDNRSDLYGLGVVLYECLIGRPPFECEDVAELVRLHAVAPVTPIRQQRSEISVGLARIVTRLLSKDPDDRYQTGEGLLHDLERVNTIDDDTRLGDADEPVVSHDLPLVGRRSELSRLRSGWTNAVGGSGGVALVSGAAGSGKSRLVRELLEEARRDDATLLTAKCSEQDPMPLAPIRECVELYLRRIQRVRTGPRHVQRIREIAADRAGLLARLTPELADVLGVRADDTGDDLQDAVAALLADLSPQDRPMLLVVDDVQWLDDASRRVLTLLAQAATERALLIVCTARDEPEYHEATNRFAAEVEAAFVTRQTLQPLDERAVADLVSAHLGGARVDERFINVIAARSGGSPFAVGEYVQAMLDEGLLRPKWGRWEVDVDGLESLALPTDVLHLVLRRVDSLGVEHRAILTAAAILGGRFELELVRQIAGVELADVQRAIAEASRGRLVEGAGFEQFSFVHDRVHEALLADQTEDGLRDLHQRAAEALDSTPVEGAAHLYALAHHYAEGELRIAPRRVYEVTLEAGLRAMGEYAADQSWTLLSVSLQAAELASVEPDPRIAHALGVTSAHTGRFRDAVRFLEDGLERTDDPVEQAKLHIALADLRLWTYSDTVGARKNLDAAYAVVKQPVPDGLVSVATTAVTAFVTGLLRRLLRRPLSDGDDLARQRVLARLHVLKAGVAYYDMDNVLFLQTAAQQYDAGTRITPSKELIDAYLAFGMLWATLGLQSWAMNCMGIARTHAEGVADRWSLGTTHLYEGFALHQLGEATRAEVIVRDALLTHGHWLETVDYLAGSSDIVWNLLMRGYASEARAWVDRAIQRACAFGHDDDDVMRAHPVFSYLISVEAMLGHPAEAARAAEATRAAIETWSTGAYAPAELAAHCIPMLVEQGELGDSLDQAIATYDDMKLAPSMVPFHLRAAYVFKARARAAQARHAEEAERKARLDQLWAAIKELRGVAGGIDVLYGHQLTLEAEYHWLSGARAKSMALLDKALAVAARCDSPWVEFDVHRLRAELIEAEAPANREARIAHSIASDHGWGGLALRLRRTMQTSAHHSRATITHSSSTRAGPETMRVQRTLESLLAVNLASATARGPVHQAQLALDEVVRLLGAERAFLFLVPRDGDRLQLYAARDVNGRDLPAGTPVASTVVERVRVSRRAAVSSGTEGGEVLRSESARSQGLRSIMAAPMELRDRLLGVIYLDTRLARGVFTDDDVDVLTAIANQVAVAVERARLQEVIEEEENQRRALERFHAPDVVRRLMQSQGDGNESGRFIESLDATILFCDLSGFTRFCDNHDAEAVAHLLNVHLSRMTEITFAWGGTVDKYIGDAIMCIFGAPFKTENDPLHAVMCAIDMRRAVRHLARSGEAGPDTDQLTVHIGVNTGSVVAGTIGSEMRMEYTALGDAVNIAARLEGVAEPDQIVIGPSTAAAVANRVELKPLGAIPLKGKAEALRAYEVLGIVDEAQDDLTDELLPGIEDG